MKVTDLLQALEEYQKKLIEHKELWGKSLSQPIPDYPVRNIDELQELTKWLNRRLGGLRPFIERFDDSWVMVHPGTGASWNALDTSIGMQAVAQAKGPSIRTCIDKVDQIIGKLQIMDPEDDIPEDQSRPIKPGVDVNYLVLGYLNHLHPFIYNGCSQLFNGCSQLFIDGHYAQAVEEAAKAVFQYIRNVTGLTGDGATLAQNAFSVKSPILAFSDLSDENKKNEQVGFMEMLKGLAKGVRNPLAHTHGNKEEAQKAFEYLIFASLLCRRIDDASPHTE